MPDIDFAFLADAAETIPGQKFHVLGGGVARIGGRRFPLRHPHLALVIEHNLDVIKTADWIVDLGPEGGEKGGLVVAEGTPEDVAKVPESYTGQYLKPMLEKRPVAAASARTR